MDMTGQHISRLCRTAGAFYALSIVGRIIVDAVVRDRLVRSSDAAATAANIVGHLALFRAGFVSEVIALASFGVVVAILHAVLRREHPAASTVAMLFGFAVVLSQAVSSGFHVAASTILANAAAFTGFSIEQVQSLALLSLRVRSVLFHSVGLVFLGLYCIVAGVLAYRTLLVPRVVGLLLALAGLAYLPFIVPGGGRFLMPYILMAAAVGQVSFALSLLLKGVFRPAMRAATA